MKRILILCAINFLCAFSHSYFADTWAGTSSNQAVTYNAFMNAVSTSAISAPYFGTQHIGNKLMTKDSFLLYTECDAYFGSLSSKTDRQLIVKSDVANYANTLSVYQRSNGTFTTACNTATAGETGGSYNTIYYNGTLAVGTKFRTLASLTGVDPALKYSGSAIGFSYTTVSSTYRIYEVTAICTP